MKFTEHLIAHITPEWRKQYIRYEEMKSLLYGAVEQAPSAEVIEPDILTKYFAKFDEQFFQYCDKELAKINTFYSEKLAEATRKFASLSSELAITEESDSFKRYRSRSKILKKHRKSGRKVHDLKLAFSEFYLSLILLQNYQNLNNTGFRKILKKHDKLLSSEAGSKWRTEWVETSHFATNNDIERIIRETETLVTKGLDGGDRQRAMKRLRVPPLGEHTTKPWTTFKLGLFSGSFIVLSAIALISALMKQRSDWPLVFRLYRGPFLAIGFLFLMGVNVYGWRSSGVNHVLIFELDPRNHLSEQDIMELAAALGVVWALSVLCCIYSNGLGIPTYTHPLILHVLLAFFLLNPTRTCRHAARFWVLKILCRIFLAPAFRVQFADFWVADQLNSLSMPLTDLHFTICFYARGSGEEAEAVCLESPWAMATRAFVAALPAWWRATQCLRRYRDSREVFPHLANAGKYASTLLVVITLAFYHHYQSTWIFYFWLITALGNAATAYTWDVKMDWGLLERSHPQLLRDETVYASPYYYYFGIIEDLGLRFGWVAAVAATELGYMNPDLVQTCAGPLEVFRRFIWNFFRLENEHLNNCGNFRAVRDISVAPLNEGTSDLVDIIRMMDETDGVIIKRSRQKHSKFNEEGVSSSAPQPLHPRSLAHALKNLTFHSESIDFN